MKHTASIIVLGTLLSLSSMTHLAGAFIPSEEEVFKALHTLKLTHYTQVNESYTKLLATATIEEQKAPLTAAHKLLTQPLVKAIYETEAFLIDLHLKAKEKKIDSFKVVNGKFRQHITELKNAFNSTFNSTTLDPLYASLIEQQAVGKMMLKKYIGQFCYRFIYTFMPFYMEASHGDEAINQAKQDLHAVDPNNSQGNRDLQIIEANEAALKVMKSLPGFVQAMVRGTMAKKIRH